MLGCRFDICSTNIKIRNRRLFRDYIDQAIQVFPIQLNSGYKSYDSSIDIHFLLYQSCSTPGRRLLLASRGRCRSLASLRRCSPSTSEIPPQCGRGGTTPSSPISVSWARRPRAYRPHTGSPVSTGFTFWRHSCQRLVIGGLSRLRRERRRWLQQREPDSKQQHGRHQRTKKQRDRLLHHRFRPSTRLSRTCRDRSNADALLNPCRRRFRSSGPGHLRSRAYPFSIHHVFLLCLHAPFTRRQLR